MESRAARHGPGRPRLKETVPYERVIAIVLTLLVGVAACAPLRGGDGTGTLRHGKSIGRGIEQALAVRSVRTSRHDYFGKRSSGHKTWLRGTRHVQYTDRAARRAPSVRAVDTLPAHWGARHLTI